MKMQLDKFDCREVELFDRNSCISLFIAVNGEVRCYRYLPVFNGFHEMVSKGSYMKDYFVTDDKRRFISPGLDGNIKSSFVVTYSKNPGRGSFDGDEIYLEKYDDRKGRYDMVNFSVSLSQVGEFEEHLLQMLRSVSLKTTHTQSARDQKIREVYEFINDRSLSIDTMSFFHSKDVEMIIEVLGEEDNEEIAWAISSVIYDLTKDEISRYRQLVQKENEEPANEDAVAAAGAGAGGISDSYWEDGEEYPHSEGEDEEDLEDADYFGRSEVWWRELDD
jgi:hypothetical protein